MKTTNYFNTFIAVAEDCPLKTAEVPPIKGNEKTIANLQFECLIENPYQYNSDDLIFKIFALRNQIAKNKWSEEKLIFFSKGQACLRTSPLAKRYAWGIHHNSKGMVAIFPMESTEYKKLVMDKNLKQLKAMRSKR